MTASGAFSSARNVRSSTAPVRKFLSFVRTNAPPLPGFTCWNSTTVMRPSGRFSAMPFFRSLVEMLIGSALGPSGRAARATLRCGLGCDSGRRPLRSPVDAHFDDEVLGEFREGDGPVRGDHEGVLDADATDAGEVHP